jgi:hypothetical protein
VAPGPEDLIFFLTLGRSNVFLNTGRPLLQAKKTKKNAPAKSKTYFRACLMFFLFFVRAFASGSKLLHEPRAW